MCVCVCVCVCVCGCVRVGVVCAMLAHFREVVMSMLLRLVEYSKVISLLTNVLDCYRKKKVKWQEVSLSL